MQSLELASIVFLDTHLLANIVCTCKHCSFINQIFMRISRHIKKILTASSIPCCIQFWNTLGTQVPNIRSIKTTTINKYAAESERGFEGKLVLFISRYICIYLYLDIFGCLFVFLYPLSVKRLNQIFEGNTFDP